MTWWKMFFFPIETLASQRTAPRIAVPLLVAAALPALAMLYVVQRIGLSRILRVVLQRQANIDLESAVSAAIANRNMVITMQAVSAFVGTMVMIFAIALVFWLVASMIGEEVVLRQFVAVTAHVTLFVATIRSVMIAVAVTLTSHPDAFDVRNPLGTNLAFYMDMPSRPVARLVTSLDLLNLTTIVLLVIGIHKVSAMPRVAAAAVVVVPWVLYVAGGVLIAFVL